MNEDINYAAETFGKGGGGKRVALCVRFGIHDFFPRRQWSPLSLSALINSPWGLTWYKQMKACSEWVVGSNLDIYFWPQGQTFLAS